jgi:subtilase family serine protease
MLCVTEFHTSTFKGVAKLTRFKQTMSDPHSSLHFLNKTLLLIALAMPLAAAQPPQRIHGEISDYSRFALSGNVRPALVHAQDEGMASASTEMPQMAIHFSMTASQKADLLNLLQLQQTRHSTQFHKWLTPEQFADRFGVNAKDMAKVTEWLESNGFSNVQAARSRTFVTFDGTAAQAQVAFHTSIHRYILNGESHLANAAAPELPSALQGIAESVRGLHDFHPRPHLQLRPHYTSGISGSHFLAPDDFATIYDLQPLYSSGITGSGVTIVVPGQTDITISDITAFQTAAGLPAKPPTVMLTGADPGTQTSSGDLGESDLDIEWAGGIAKGANIVFVTSTDFFTSVTYAIDNNLGAVMPMTYGACESGTGSAEITSLNAVFQQAVAEGMTLLAASGDDGAADCDGSDANTVTQYATQGLAVDFPASSPYVTGMGGTEFNEGTGTYWNTTNNAYGGSAVSYIPEIAWNDTNSTDGLAATGGGASISFTKPNWQAGVSVPNDGARDVPDLALDASPSVDGLLICSDGWCTNGFRNTSTYLDVTGGTSASSPSFGAIVALLVQKTGARQGNINQNLYTLASVSTDAFHDITSGSNVVPCQGGSPNCSSKVATVQGTLGFSAGTGYDQVTGLGSVDAYHLINEWTADLQLSISPTTLTVTRGTSGTATVTAAESNFSAPVTFTCSVGSAITNTTCAVANISGGGTTTLTITAGATASTPWWQHPPTLPTTPRGLLFLLSGLLLATSVLLLVRQKKMRAVSLPFACSLVLALSGCGSGNTASTTPTTTSTVVTPQTASVVVTGVSGSYTSNATISVTVQ